MSLQPVTDTFLLGSADVSDRVISCDLTFGANPYTHRIHLSDGTLVLRNNDGRVAAGNFGLTITRATAGDSPAQVLWQGIARANPRTSAGSGQQA